MQRPNVQNVYVIDQKSGARRKMKVCTKCLKAGKVVRG